MSRSRFELALADGDGGGCVLLCPVCSNSQTRLIRAICADDGLSILLRNACGHSWRLILEKHDDELRIEAHP